MTHGHSALPGELPIRSEPEWTNVHLDEGFTDTFCVVGDRILVSRPEGRATDDGTERAFAVVEQVVEAAIPAPSTFVWIADYSSLSNASRATRRRFARRVADFDRLSSLILCGLPPALRMAARMARLVRIASANVHVVDSFEEGLVLARRELAVLDHQAEREPGASEVISSPDWRLDLAGLNATWRILRGDELHLELVGAIRREHVDALLDLQEEILRNTGIDRGQAFLVVDLSEVHKIGYRARRHYVDRLTAWFRTAPFRMEVAHGANPVVRAAFNLSRAFAPFEAVLAEDRAAAEALVAERRAADADGAPAVAPSPAQSAVVGGGLEAYADELVRALGAVTWGVEAEIRHRDPEHPLSAVFEAIELVREDLDEIHAERAQVDEEQRHLQHRLDQASKMEALGLLAAGIAHDLNNALSGIVTYPEVLLMDVDLPPKVRDALENVLEYGKGAQAVVDDLASATCGVDDTRIAMDVRATVEAVMSEVTPDGRVDGDGLHLEVVMDDDLLPVLASPLRLRRVVRNLLEASLAAVPREHGRVRVEAHNYYADREVRGLEAVPEGEYVRLVIRDNGPPVPEEDRERLFEPFFAKKRLGRGGTGLGLTAVWSSLHADGGALDVHSGPDGTSFEAFMAVARLGAGAVPETADGEVPRGRGERVLVADDVEVQRDVARTILEALGYTAEVVASGEEAITALKRSPADLVLLDMVMDPGLSGHETLHRIRTFLPDLPAIVASGHCLEEDLDAARSLGLAAVLRKPYTVADLATAVRRGLRGDDPG